MQKLFTDFKPTTAAEWKAQLLKDLKGDTYENLVWQNENGFDIQPFYTAEDLNHTYEPAFTHASWEICVSAKGKDSKKINAQLLQQLNAGATAISLNVTGLDLEVALRDIQLNYIQSTFFVNAQSVEDLRNYLENQYDVSALQCSVFTEELKSSAGLEDWYKTIIDFKNNEGIKTLSADTLPFHNQNCLAYYEIAIALSQLTEYIEFFAAKKEDLPQSKFVIKTGVSSDYFIQMAKLRAVRRLWTVLKKEYNLSNDLHLIVETTLTNKSISDNYNNLLRTTVESMAAISGGCNELIVTGFDVLFPANKILSERMSVNQQLVLREESYFDKMADTACGSFYIESITDALAEKALETFKYFEKEGGYFKCLEKSVFINDIKVQAEKRNELLKTQKQVSIGVNKFKNEKERIEIGQADLDALTRLDINNPVLKFELENFFNKADA